MSRAAIAAVVAIALASATIATAGSIGYGGEFEGGGKLSFALKERDGKRYVVRWRWRDFPVACANGPQVTSGKYLFRLRVRRREFGGRAVLRSASGQVVGGAKVRGEFGRGYETAAGAFRVYGRTPEGYRDCESGRTPWSAAREVVTPPKAWTSRSAEVAVESNRYTWTRTGRRGSSDCPDAGIRFEPRAPVRWSLS